MPRLHTRSITHLATDGGWPVTVKQRSGNQYEVSGRGTCFDLFMSEAAGGHLLSVPNFQRCGVVPADCTPGDIQRYVGITNKVDATTLATAVRYLLQEKHPGKARASALL